jgi:hypothetical protein
MTIRRRSTIEMLERRGLLRPRQAIAAKRLSNTYALGIVGVRREGAGGELSVGDAKLAAKLDYDRARDALGFRLWPIAWSVVCNDLTVQDLSAELHLHPTATMALLKLALEELADHYMLSEGD